MPRAAQLTRLDSRPTARSRARRRIALAQALTSDSSAHRYVVLLETLLASAHFWREVPCAMASARSVFRFWRSSSDMAQIALGGKLPPRILMAPLAVLSPGPRLAGTPSRGREMTSGNGPDVFVAKMAGGSGRWSANGSTDHPRVLSSRSAENGKKWDWMGQFRRAPVPSGNIQQRNASAPAVQWFLVLSC